MFKKQKIRLSACPYCGFYIPLNGVGSDANAFQKMLKATLGAINPVTTTLFEPCADVHDMEYHWGDVENLGLFEAQKDDDDLFWNLCHYMVEYPEESPLGIFNRSLVRSARPYFRHKANQYHWALRKGGASVYPKLTCTNPNRVWKQGERYSEQDLENASFAFEIV